jgi:hypothetical protein
MGGGGGAAAETREGSGGGGGGAAPTDECDGGSGGGGGGFDAREPGSGGGPGGAGKPSNVFFATADDGGGGGADAPLDDFFAARPSNTSRSEPLSLIEAGELIACLGPLGETLCPECPPPISGIYLVARRGPQFRLSAGRSSVCRRGAVPAFPAFPAGESLR